MNMDNFLNKNFETQMLNFRQFSNVDLVNGLATYLLLTQGHKKWLEQIEGH